MDGQPNPGLTLRDAVRLIRRRGWVPILVAATFMALAYGWSERQAVTYEAKTTVSVTTTDFSSILLDQPGATDDKVQTELEVMRSGPFLDEVADALGYDAEFETEDREGTDLISITATAGTSVRAAEAANVFADTYQEYRRELAAESTADATAELNAEIADLRARIDEEEGTLRVLRAQLANLPVTPETESQRAVLENSIQAEQLRIGPRLANLDARLNTNEQLLGQIQLAETITAGGGVEVLTPAVEPDSPVAPKPLRNGLAAGVVGLLVGIAAVLVIHRLDDRMRDPNVLESVTHLPVLATVPVAAQPKNQPSWLVSVAEPTTPAAEAYRSLRTGLQFLVPTGSTVVQITSAVPLEGKSTTSANLGVVFAGAGHRTIVVGLDLRRPSLHHLLGADGEHGFSTLVVGVSSYEEAIRPYPAVPLLDVLPAGPLTPNPSELLQLRRTRQIIDDLRASYDVIILDTPPVLPVSDAAIVSGLVDATVFATMSGRSRRREVVDALDRLRNVEAPLVGTIMSGLRLDVMYGRYYGYDLSAHPVRLSSETSDPDDGPTPEAGASGPRRPGRAGRSSEVDTRATRSA